MRESPANPFTCLKCSGFDFLTKPGFVFKQNEPAMSRGGGGGICSRVVVRK